MAVQPRIGRWIAVCSPLHVDQISHGMESAPTRVVSVSVRVQFVLAAKQLPQGCQCQRERHAFLFLLPSSPRALPGPPFVNLFVRFHLIFMSRVPLHADSSTTVAVLPPNAQIPYPATLGFRLDEHLVEEYAPAGHMPVVQQNNHANDKGIIKRHATPVARHDL